jgi:virginiamycin A acetyltransferase
MTKEMEYKDLKISGALLSVCYRINNRFLRKAIRKLLLMREGGGLYSKTLRKLLSQYHGIEIGMYSMFRSDHYANLPRGTTVGRYCSLAEGLLVINGSHPVRHKSTHALFFNPACGGYVEKLLIPRRTSLIIGNDVYIGSNVMILPNVTSIGTGAVIAAGSAVVKNVPPFAVVGGNPAKIIKYRFSQQVIDHITKSAWWEKDIDELKADEKEFAKFLQPLE